MLATGGILFPRKSSAQKFSLICMPDPQFYTNSNHPSLYGLYDKQAEWIRDNMTTYNIKHVIWLGDLTNNNILTQWSTANHAYQILDNANIPYAVVPGNHDYRTNNSDSWVGADLRDLTKFNGIVGPSRFLGKSWYGGNMGETTTHNENNYTFFSSGNLKFLVIGLEYAPRKEVLTWANHLISQYPDYRVILFTHMYLRTNGVYSSTAGSATGTVGAAGEDIFNECASRNSNVFLVVCGHVTESKVNTKKGVAGNTVYEMLVDYQAEKVLGTGDELGNGWLRILQFDPSTNLIRASTISAGSHDPNIFTNGIDQFYHSNYSHDPNASDHLFSLNYHMGPLPPYTYLNASTGFHDMSVNNSLTGDHLEPTVAAAENGDWVTAWADDANMDGIYQIMMRGFDYDGNERIAKKTVITSGIGTVNTGQPSIAMAPDGRFVIVWRSSSTAIKVRTYDANGTPVGTTEQTVVSVASPGSVNTPRVAMDASGNFVVTWADDSDGNGSYDIKARGFTFNYIQRFAGKTVNTQTTGQQQDPVITMSPIGNYVIAWDDDQDNDGIFDVDARGFFSNETQRFPQIVATTSVNGQQWHPAIAMNGVGQFVVVWEDDTDGNGAYQVRAKGFNPTGTELFSERTVNVISSGNQLNPSVAMDTFGNWYPVWEDNGAVSGGQGYQILSNEFDITGKRLNDADVRVNTVTKVSHNFGTPTRKSPVVAAHKSGHYLVEWADDIDGDGAFQDLARGMSGTARSLVVKSYNGAITKSPSEVLYAPNETVSITAVPQPGYVFVGWSGDVPVSSQSANPVQITMDTSKNITANYLQSSSIASWPLY